MSISARAFNFYDEMGINLNDLGCVMLRTDNPLKKELNPDEGIHIPQFPWATGVQEDWHLTLRYGFLPQVKRKHVDGVLSQVVIPSHVSITGFDCFRSEDYECVVARVDPFDVRHIYDALGILPNVATFVPYKPHITLGYFEPGWYAENQPRMNLKPLVHTGQLIYGDSLERV